MRTRAVSSTSQAGMCLPHSDSKGVYLEDLRDISDIGWGGGQVPRRPRCRIELLLYV